MAGLIIANRELGRERELESEREKPVAAKSRVKPGANGEATLTLEDEAQNRIALQVEPVRPAKLDPELKGFGRVLDPAPLAALAAELASAQAALAASEKEFDRLKLLNAQEKNASDRAVQMAEATARRDQILVESVRTRLALAWGQAVADQAGLPAFVRSLSSLDRVVVRLDLPAGEVLPAPPVSARIVLASLEEHSIPAQFLGPAPAVDAQVQGQGFLFLAQASSPRLAFGKTVTGYVQLPGERLSGFVVPDSAVVRHAGQGWVYVQTHPDTFMRRRIPLDHRTDTGWFVPEGVAANERVVVSGAQALLSEEQKYQIKLLE
jgi:hypothetical protein